MGSVTGIVLPPYYIDQSSLPACFSYAGYLAFVSQFPKTDTADTVFAEHSMRTAANAAPRIVARRKLRAFLLFVDHRFFRHFLQPP
jgi:hypothetical protein